LGKGVEGTTVSASQGYSEKTRQHTPRKVRQIAAIAGFRGGGNDLPRCAGDE